MSTIDRSMQEEILKAYYVGKVVSAFRVSNSGKMDWEIGRVVDQEKHSRDGEILGLVVQFFSDGGTVDYPLECIGLSDESFVMDIAHEDVVRETWPVGTLGLVKLVGHQLMPATVIGHSQYGIRLETNIGTTSFAWDDFTDDGRCSELSKIKMRKKP